MYIDFAFQAFAIASMVMFFVLMLESVEEQHRQFRLNKESLPCELDTPCLSLREREEQEQQRFQEENGVDFTEYVEEKEIDGDDVVDTVWEEAHMLDEEPTTVLLREEDGPQWMEIRADKYGLFEIWEGDQHSAYLTEYTKSEGEALAYLEYFWMP